MKYENDFDTEVQKVGLFNFLPTIILPDDKESFDLKSKFSEKKRSSI